MAEHRGLMVAVGVVVATVAFAAPAGAETGVSNGKSYTVTMASRDGATPDNLGHWRVQAGQISGGDPAVVEAFNTASQSCADREIDAVRAEAGQQEYTWDFASETHVTFRSIAIGQVISGTWSADRAARVVRYVSTVVIDTRTSRPIALADLFTDVQDGVNRLSEHTDGIPPRPENFTNWVPTAEGIQVHFASAQWFWPPAITVPWSALTDVLAPSMPGLAQG